MGVVAVPFFMGDRIGLEVNADVIVEPPLPDGSPQTKMGLLYQYVADAVAADPSPVVWAGDCVSILGVAAGLQRRDIDPTLVFFDAHGDFNTWETTPSEFIGGMPLAMAVGRGEQTIAQEAGMSTLSEDNVWLVDGRDLDPPERDALQRSAVRQVTVADVAGGEVPDGPLYVHVDVDVVDPEDMPAMNYPAPGGPSLDAVAEALGALAATGRVAAFSMSVFNPELPGADRAEHACRRLAAIFNGDADASL